MKYLLIVFITISATCFSQSKDICEHTTEGNPNANTLKLKITVPCEWKSEYLNVPFGVGKFVYTRSGLMATLSLVIGNIDAATTDKEAQELLTESGLRILTKGATQYGNTRKLKINGVNGDEIILKNTDRGKIFYSIQDYFIYNRKLVLIQYTVASKNTEDFKTWQPFFNSLLQNTKFAKL
mgnify:FL=1